MSEVVNQPSNDSSKPAEFDPELQFYHDATQEDLNRQVEVLGILDTKSAILVALNAGTLALVSSWPSTGVSKWLGIAALITILLALCVSIVAIFPRRLELYLSTTLLNEIKEQTEKGPIGRSREVLQQLIDHDKNNHNIVKVKLLWTERAVRFSIAGFVLLGVAHIVRIAIP